MPRTVAIWTRTCERVTPGPFPPPQPLQTVTGSNVGCNYPAHSRNLTDKNPCVPFEVLSPSCSQAGSKQPRRAKTEAPFKIEPLLNGRGQCGKILLMYLSLATGQSGRTWEAWQRWKGGCQKPALLLGAVGRNEARWPCSDCSVKGVSISKSFQGLLAGQASLVP